jgi:hypothetical protein
MRDVLGQTISPIFKDQEIHKREKRTTEVNWHVFLLRECVHRLNFKETRCFGSQLRFRSKAKKRLTWLTPFIELLSITWQKTNQRAKWEGRLTRKRKTTSLYQFSHSFVTTSLGSISDTLIVTGISLMLTISRHGWRPRCGQTEDRCSSSNMLGHNFGWKAFWNSNQEWSC